MVTRLAEIAERALERTRAAGADAADTVLVEGDSLEARVRGDEIDFVKQARERTLGIRALVCPVTSFTKPIIARIRQDKATFDLRSSKVSST